MVVCHPMGCYSTFFLGPEGLVKDLLARAPVFFFLMGTLIIADVVKSVLPCALHVLPFQPWLSICNFAFNSAEVHWLLVKKITRESKVQSKMIRDYCKILCPGFQAAVMQLTTNTYHFLTQESEGIQRPKTSIFANRDLLPAHIQS